MSEEITRVIDGQPHVKVSAVRKSKIALRDVSKDSTGFLQLVESVREKGVLMPIIVREVTDENGEKGYGLVDGLQRFTAAETAGLEWIPATFKSMDDAEAMDAQIIANLHRIETKPKEYTEQLLRILSSNPLMTERELAQKLCVSDAFIQQRLSLTKLNAKVMELVNAGSVNLSNAYALAKLPEEEQGEYVDRAMTEQPKVFVSLVSARAKQLRDAKFQGRDAKPAEFTAVATLRKVKDVKAELDSCDSGKVILATSNITDTLTAWKEAIKWAMSLDEASVQAQKAKWEEAKRQREEAKEQRRVEREQKKAELAAQTAADITAL